MGKKNIIIIGIGRRVREDVLPVLEASQKFNVVGVYAKSARNVQIGGYNYLVKTLAELKVADTAKADFIYLSVPSGVLSGVLKFLVTLNVKNICLLMDTPVLPWRQVLAKKYFKYFLKTHVIEDIIYLPWIEPVKKLLGGKITNLVFDHSVYAYHGIALIKMLVDCGTFKKARLRTLPETKIELISTNGVQVTIIEPRDYSKGFMNLIGPAGAVTDNLSDIGKNIMRPIILNNLCVGLQIGSIKIDFSPVEIKLIGGVLASATITSLTLQLKRIGLLKMLVGLADGKDYARNVEDATKDVRLNEKLHYFGKWINVA